MLAKLINVDLSHLIPMNGFEKAVQASAYVVLGCLVIGNALVKTSYPLKSLSEKTVKPDVKSFFKDPPYMWAVLGYFNLFHLSYSILMLAFCINL